VDHVIWTGHWMLKLVLNIERLFTFNTFGFCAVTKVFVKAMNTINFLDCDKKFGPAQNILRPVEGQGIIIYLFDYH
jgi:hypothetical protein